MLIYLPALADLFVVALAILLFWGMTVIGAAVAGRERHPAFDPLVGWAILCLPFLLLGTLTTLSFVWIDGICVAIFAASFVLCLSRGITGHLKGWLPYVCLALPFLVVVAPTDLYGWDQLSHWLPNTNYIAAFQHFPREGLPPSTSQHAGYPYGFALSIYWVEMFARLIAVPARTVGVAAVLNVLLFVVAARMLVEQVRELPIRPGDANGTALGAVLFTENGWLAAGFALLLLTALSPTFLPTNSISASADNPTSVVLLAIAFAILPERISNGRPRSMQRIQLPLILVLAAFLKEDNIVPVVALFAGRLVWDVRMSREPSRTFRDLAAVALPMLVAAGIWHLYAFLHIPQGEMSLRPPAEWRVDLLPRIAGGMAVALASKIGFFACVLATLLFAGRALVRPASEADPARVFVVIAAAGFIGYTVFLAFAYVGIFSVAEAERQAAFWRYETHLGLVLECAIVLLACGIGMRKRPLRGSLALAVAGAMLVAPVVFAPVIRPDLDPQSRTLEAMGKAVAPLIAGAKDIAIVDQTGSGAPCPMIVYEASNPVRLAECVTKISPCPLCLIRTAATHESFIWANGWSSALSQSTGLRLPANASYLLGRTGGRWSVIAKWAKTPTKTRGVRTIWQGA